MPGKLVKFFFTVFIAISLSGCIAAMSIMADTAKAKQCLDIPYSQALDVVRATFKALDIRFKGADIKQDIAEVKGEYTDRRVIRIFISKDSDTRSCIAVRAGTSGAGKKEADKILKAIIDYYDLSRQGPVDADVK